MRIFKISFILIILNVFMFLSADPPNWQVITGTQYSMVMIAQASLYGSIIEGDNGNIIAAFGPGGESDCRSIAMWQPLTPPEESFWYSTIVGNTGGEPIIFKFYEAASDQIFTFNETVVFQDNQTYGSPTDPFQLTIQNSFIGGTISLITNTPPAASITEVIIECDGQTTNPNSSGYYQFELTSGFYDISAQLDGYVTVTLENIELIGNQSVSDADITLIDWEQISGTQYSMVLMTTADVFGVPISGGIGNIVAAFGPNGDTDCRGIAEWQDANPPYWEGYWYFTLVGNSAGEMISFQIFEKATETIYECTQLIEFIDNETIGSPEEPYNISNGSIQSFNLNENWNWISFNVHPDNTLIETVFAPLVNDINQVKSQSESSVYYSPSGNWVGDLLEITDGEAYLVQMNNAVSGFEVEGSPIDPSAAISLDISWNWVAYYPLYSLEIGEALFSIEDNVYQVKNQNQSSTYINPPGSWQGDLDFMEPDQGYKIFMYSPDELIYIPSDNDLQVVDNDLPMMDPPDWQQITGTQYSMILMAEASLNGEDFTNEGENTIAAFGPGGETDCRSIGYWQEPNPPNYDGFWYFTIVGNDNGDEIIFKLYDEATDQVFDCNETIIFADNETIGSPDDLYEITATGSGIGDDQIPQEADCSISVFPNPFNPSTTISFELSTETTGNAELVIYNLKGQKIKTFSNNQISKSANKQIIWNGIDDNKQPVSTGIYFVKLKTGKETLTKKLMLLK
ncbi:MAG: hypothetical protein DRI23_04855 [Candidatus Cloacimonadota bacterium]|nr:MAG: hypothetical protein DRI23_04855 [Candidatus Cloacimonadota bacterium]